MHAHVRGAARLVASVLALTVLGAGAAQAAKAPPKQLELYAIDCGRLPVPNADGFADDGSYKGLSREMVVPCYLIRHPKGDLVWDTGVPQSKEKLLAGLQALDLTPADIEFISVSHSHFDHIGNAGLFAAVSTWIVDPDEKAYASSDRARATGAQFAAYSALENARTVLVEGPSYDVFGDKTVVIHQAPGHTPGHTILELKLKSGTVLLTGDLWHIAESRAGKKVPRFNTDRAQTLKSYELTEALAVKTKARLVVREHVPEDFDALPKFPQPLK